MNAFDVRALALELSQLVGGRFDKAFQPARQEVLLRFRLSSGAVADDDTTKRELAVAVGRWACLTRTPRENPAEPPPFAMSLRRHLSGGRVIGIRQHAFDRVLEIEIERKEGVFTLVLEFFSDGNLILSKGGKIIVPLSHQSWATREIRPGADLVFPPERIDPFTITREAFREKVRGSTSDAVRTLATELNLGGQWAEEICARAGVAKNTPVAELAPEAEEALFAALKAIVARFERGELEPVLVKRKGKKVDVAPLRLAEHEGAEVETFPTFNDALDAYFGAPSVIERVDPRVKKLNEERARLDRMLAVQKAAVEKFEREGVEYREKGDLLYAHFDVVSRVATKLIEAARASGWPDVQAKLKEARKAGHPDAKTIESVNPADGTATLAVEDYEGRPMRVKVDLTKSVQENAEACYERAKKAREKLAGAATALAMTEDKKRRLEAEGAKVLAEVERARTKPKATKRFWYEGYRWFLASTGHLVLGGRDASSNEKLVKKHLGDADRYVHADIHGAPSVVVKADAEGGVSDAALAEAGAFAVSMSKAWASGLASGDAYWVAPTQVSRTPNPGEFLAKGAFIIRGKRNYANHSVRLAVGEVEIDGVRKIMGGPPPAVKTRAKRWLEIEPGERGANDLANALSKVFDVPVEEIQPLLPPGPLRVVASQGVDA